MPGKKKLKWETFKDSDEIKLWIKMADIFKRYEEELQKSYISLKELGGLYWEPLLEKLLKFAVMLKINHKMKELRMDWIRPVLFLPDDANTGVIKFDGRVDYVEKEAVANAINIQMVLKNLLGEKIYYIYKIEDDKTFQEYWKPFKSEVNDLFKSLSTFVKKGWRQLHEYLKLVLKPLRSLRKAGYRLYSIEQLESGHPDLVMFKYRDSLDKYQENVKQWFTLNDFIIKKPEKLPDFQEKTEAQLESMTEKQRNEYKKELENYEYKLNEMDNFLSRNFEEKYLRYDFIKVPDKNEDNDKNKRNYDPYETQSGFKKDKISGRKDKSKSKEDERNMLQETFEYKKLVYPNINTLTQPEPTRFRYEAYQLKFEEGLAEMLEYLRSKLSAAFHTYIDTHKIFVNLKYIPLVRKNKIAGPNEKDEKFVEQNEKEMKATNYWLDQLKDKIQLLKQKCYELKVNGLSRVLLPISKNKNIIQVIKDVYDLHRIVNDIMGNYLLYDQYMFIYDKIDFLMKSSMKDDLDEKKNIGIKRFMEEVIPKYIFFEALSHAVDVMDKMEKSDREQEKYFKKEKYYQILEYDFDGSNSLVINEYELSADLKPFYTPEIDEEKKKLYDEIRQYGRFWILEGFFDKQDKELWINAIDILYTINKYVREDMRDEILKSKEVREEDPKKFQNKEINSNTQSNNISKSSSRHDLGMIKPHKTNKKKGTVNSKDSKKTKNTFSRRNSRSSSFTDDPLLGKAMKNINYDELRPPYVWNYPIHEMKEMKDKVMKTNETNIIRNVDTNLNYQDGRVQKFKELFEVIYKNAIKYDQEKGNHWYYFFDKVLLALNINYEPYKLKAELRRENEPIYTEEELEEQKLNRENEEIYNNKLQSLEEKEGDENEKEDVKENEK